MTKRKLHAPLENRHRLGHWLPEEEAKLVSFRREMVERSRAGIVPKQGSSAAHALAHLVDTEPVLRMHLTRAIGEAREVGYELGYASIEQLMQAIAYVTTSAPRFDKTSLVVCPLNALLDWPMCMPSGFALFRHPQFNTALKHVLEAWGAFLSGPHSCAHLNTEPPHGWFCPEALDRLRMDAFIHHPTQPHWGFASWNDFFTRRLRAGARPVEDAEDPGCILNACEASPYQLAHDVQEEDTFWIKSQPYSLRDIFGAGHAHLAGRFRRGTIYQAFLSAFNYHRWHAPVSGTVVEAYRVDGTYYSCVESEGIDPEGLNDSQGYSTAMATRAIVVIDSDEPALGQVACVFVGMAEVSSCVIDIALGQHVQKGEELGYFQYGGSTYCLVFQPGAIRGFAVSPPFADDSPPLAINTRLATAALSHSGTQPLTISPPLGCSVCPVI
ncbi:phosphatidylserine decarboxylase family protein [Ralstonia insidiosa]|uniref:phosphatidylserine decarboxylase family protein n=2 Tax=Pseudomonadota TaxID=1224 RepID=UPI00066498B9|nr:phosphatidylserine decarboxylase family protein [Ralstonia insidiosa]KMW45710.1 phosphatidylserine decarboxylase [Ralstonia sp. MD27]MCK8650570.1 phosphatidylserine decarboxylase family protein [Ralstonia insidiosa]MDE4926447.1 phosphatidylserine decarboxylase family protein [Ralstonia insidiosa]UNK02138.1 phosphatidylserine decarboxylase family protein [Ralstonia insidiosa]